MYTHNPDILEIPLENGFVSLINPYIPNGIKLLNPLQYKIFTTLNQSDKKDIIDKFALTSSKFDLYLQALELKGFISKTNNFQKDLIAPKHFRSLDLWIHVTDFCNLQCRYCFVSTKETKQSFDTKKLPLMIENLKSIIEENEINELSIRYSGGEALTKFEILKQIHQAFLGLKKSLKINIKFLILTNLVNLNTEVISYLAINEIQVSTSLDGIDSSSNSARLRQDHHKNYYSIIIDNIHRLQKSGISVIVQTVITNSNLESLEKTIFFFVEHEIKFRLGIVHGESLDFEQLFNVLNTVYEKLKKNIINGYKISNYHILGELKFTNQNCYNCAAGINSFLLYINGDIYFCPQELGHIPPRSNLARNTNLQTLFNSISFQQNKISGECSACIYKNICNNGCPLDRVNGKTPACAFNKKIIPIIYKLLSYERLYTILASTLH